VHALSGSPGKYFGKISIFRGRIGLVCAAIGEGAEAMTHLSDMNPEELLILARQGDDEARDALLQQYRDYLSVLARVHVDRHLQAKVDDSDLVQETMLQAHRDFPQFRGTTEAALAAWLRSIMANKGAVLARRFYGTKQRDPRLERQIEADLDRSSVALAGAIADPGSSPSQRAARRERAVLLADALGQLPSDYREVMILHHLEDLRMPEVAERMGRSVDSVRKLWARAMVQLRGLLGDIT
jgi:RNA polymerase sigma-70 factor (ECF subfamily)